MRELTLRGIEIIFLGILVLTARPSTVLCPSFTNPRPITGIGSETYANLTKIAVAVIEKKQRNRNRFLLHLYSAVTISNGISVDCC